MGLLAQRAQGGLQAMSVVETAVAATATSLFWLLNGCTKASTAARDSLKEATTEQSHDTADDYKGIVPDAMRFLAGYGYYLTAATDRTTGRILDAIMMHRGTRPHGLVGPFDR
jgi:hypothetical protein